MKRNSAWIVIRAGSVSVLSVEPWGMKLLVPTQLERLALRFSALGRAVGDETRKTPRAGSCRDESFSALGRAVGDETQTSRRVANDRVGFSALGRAVGDETQDCFATLLLAPLVSVLSVEPWGMKQDALSIGKIRVFMFQCSRSSRGG